MDKIDIFQVAKLNSNEINRKFSVASESNPFLRSFAVSVQNNATISINRSGKALLEFIDGNILAAGPEAAEKNKIPIHSFLNFQWGRKVAMFVWRRIFFLQVFAEGEHHLFGALNMGGAGAAARNAAYGCYCIVLKREVLLKLKAAYCKYDTLAFWPYWTCLLSESSSEACKTCKIDYFICGINASELFKDYATFTEVGKHAALKHKDEIHRDMSISEIANILINKPKKDKTKDETEDYIEVCFVKENLSLDDVSEVRVHKRLAPQVLREAIVSLNDGRRGSVMSIHNELKLQLGERLVYQWEN